MSETIVFTAEVYKVQTLATDGGVRVTLNLPETAIMQMAQLAECQRFGVPLEITAIPATCTESYDETKKGTERSDARVDRRRSTNRRDKRSGS